MKNYLAIDTSTQACSVALQVDGIMYRSHQLTPQTHANLLLEMIQALLSEANTTPDKIDYLVYGEGPGAFTGIRIAAGAIQGLALGWDKPVIAVSSLEAMMLTGLELCNQDLTATLAPGLNFDRPVKWLAVLDARMQEVYTQVGCYQRANDNTAFDWQAEPVTMLSLEIAEQQIAEMVWACITSGEALVVCGDIQNEYPQLMQSVVEAQAKGQQIRFIEALPHADAMIQIAKHRLSQNLEAAKALDEQLPKPVYLRNHVADTIAERKAKQVAKNL